MSNLLIKEKLINYIFFLILIFYPLANLIHYFIPKDIYGVNLYSLICFLSIYIIFFLKLLKSNLNYLKILVVLTFLSFLFLLLINFSIHPTNSNYFKQYEIGITFFIINTLCFLIIEKKNSKIVASIIIFSCLIQALFSIINEFITYNKITFFNYDDENRQTGFLLNANLFSSFILTGLILTFHQKFFFNNHTYNILKTLIIIIFFLALYYTESRFSIYISVVYLLIFVFYSLYKKFNSNKFILSSIIITSTLIISSLLFFKYIGSINNRIVMGFNDEIRIIKYYLGIKTILLNPIDLLFGMNREMFSQLRILNTRLSDNSIIYLIMYFGIPYTCFLFFSIYSVCIKYLNINLFFIIIFIILILNLFLTGAIFWHVYLLYFSSTLVLIFKKIE